MNRILLVDDEVTLQTTLTDTLEDEGYEVMVAGDVAEARSFLAREAFDLILCDLRLPDGTGIDVLERTRELQAGVPVIILTAFGTVESAVEAMKSGAAEYLTKPFEEAQLLAVVRRQCELTDLRRRVRQLEALRERPLGVAPSFLKVLELAETVAPTDATVLLLGETGTGKEVLARHIHACSKRSTAPFVAVNCAALPETLLEAELFGHEKGAFTGAVRARRGRFEAANGGTLFLDEVAEMSPVVQAKLLRVLQERTFERLGSNVQVSTDVRLAAATRRDLAAEVREGRFRDDLYYRLRVVPIEIPPLRERPGDVAILAQHFMKRYAAEFDREMTLAPEVLQWLESQELEGNVRELENLMQRLVVTCPNDVVRIENLPKEYRTSAGVRVRVDGVRLDGTLSEQIFTLEGLVLQEALRRFGGHRGRMAEALGISRKNLWEKLKAHGLGEPRDGTVS